MTVPYLLRFCPFRALMCMLFGIHTQGVASLALGYALVGLSARSNPRVSLRLPWAMRSLGFQPALIPGCRFACPGRLSPALPKSETHICCLYIVICCFYEFAKYILLRAVLLLHVKFPLLVFKVFNYRIKSRTT